MDFYVTLPSSVGSDPSNTSARFTTRLPETLRLKKGKTVVGLTDIIYPCSFLNVPKETFYEVRFKEDDTVMRVVIPAAHYDTADKLQQILLPQQNSPGATSGKKSRIKSVAFTFNRTTERFEFRIADKEVKQVELQKELAYFLGFSETVFTQSAPAKSPVDFTNNVNTMYIYCDIVDYSIVGDQKTNLLQCCPLTGTFGRMTQHTFNPIRYLPISQESIDSIRIELRNELGNPMPFNWGSTIVNLHFKQI